MKTVLVEFNMLSWELDRIPAIDLEQNCSLDVWERVLQQMLEGTWLRGETLELCGRKLLELLLGKGALGIARLIIALSHFLP